MMLKKKTWHSKHGNLTTWSLSRYFEKISRYFKNIRFFKFFTVEKILRASTNHNDCDYDTTNRYNDFFSQLLPQQSPQPRFSSRYKSSSNLINGPFYGWILFPQPITLGLPLVKWSPQVGRCPIRLAYTFHLFVSK